MRVGVPREIKVHEYRVGLTPTAVRELVARGHQALVERGAGAGIGAADSTYEKAGATIVDDVYSGAELIVKVKEPQSRERARLRTDQVLFTYFHLAPDPEQARELIASGATCIAYETVTGAGGGLPLLAPMSEVAGRMAIQVGAACLEKAHGGMGTLLAGVPGVPSAKVVVLGAGVAGSSAARIAVGMGARVFALDRSVDALRRIESEFGARVVTVYSSRDAIEQHVLSADLVIGAVLVPGAAAPRLVSRALLARMKRGAALVDVSIDQGGCFETSRPTTHADPTYVVDGVVHYCVANMPGAYARTATQALTNVTHRYIELIADHGLAEACEKQPALLGGINVMNGRVTCEAVADAHRLPFTRP